MKSSFEALSLIAEIRAEADGWEAKELNALRRGFYVSAAMHRCKAHVLRAFATRLEARLKEE